MGLFTLDKDLLPENWKKSGPSGKPVLREPPKVRPREPVYLVTDTSWWMEQGWYDAIDIAEKAPEVFFVIPAGVMRELDGLKYNENKTEKAREATKQIFNLIQKRKAEIVKGTKLIEGFLSSPVDEEVLSVAKSLERKAKVILLTTDYAMMAVAENEKIESKKDWKWTSPLITNNLCGSSIKDESYYLKFLIFFFGIFCIGLISLSPLIIISGILGIFISFVKWGEAMSRQTKNSNSNSGSKFNRVTSTKKDNF